MSQATPVGGGIFAVLLAAILWGTTGTSAAMAQGVSPLAIGAAAMGGGGLLQALIVLKTIGREWQPLIRQRRYLLSGALAAALYPLAFYAAMDLAGIATGTVVAIGSTPLLSALIEWVMEKQPLNRQWGLGALLGITGIVLLSLAESQAPTLSGDWRFFAGLGLALVAGFTYAFYSWSARRMMQHQVAPRAAMGATFGTAALLLLPVLLLTGAPLLASTTNLAVALYMMLVPMFIGYLCYGYGLSRIKASTAITLTLAEPLVAALLAVFLVGETLPFSGWCGIGLIILCLAVTSLPAGCFRLRRRPEAG